MIAGVTPFDSPKREGKLRRVETFVLKSKVLSRSPKVIVVSPSSYIGIERIT